MCVNKHVVKVSSFAQEDTDAGIIQELAPELAQAGRSVQGPDKLHSNTAAQPQTQDPRDTCIWL